MIERKVILLPFLLYVLIMCMPDVRAQELDAACMEFSSMDMTTANISSETLLNEARCWYENGNTFQAKQYLNYINNADSTNVRSRSLLAVIYRNEHNYAAAAGMYKRLISIDSLKSDYYRNYGDMLKASELYRDATVAYRQAIIHNGDDLRSHLSLAEIFFQLDNYRAAKAHINNILSIDTGHLRGLQLAQKIALKAGKWEKVLHLRDKMDEFAALNTATRRRTAYAYMKVDSARRAIHILRNIADKRNPETTFLYMAMSFEKLEEYDKAEYFYKRSVREAIPASLPFHMKLYAGHLERRKKFAKAYDIYKQAYDLTSDPAFLYALGRVSEYAYADKSMAVRYYQAYVEADGERHRTEARKRLSYLRSIKHMKSSRNEETN